MLLEAVVSWKATVVTLSSAKILAQKTWLCESVM